MVPLTLLTRGLQMASLSITGEGVCGEDREKCCFLCAPRAVFLHPRIDFGLILLHNGPPGESRSVFREGLHNFAIIRFPCFSMERLDFLTRSGLFHKGDIMKTLITMMIFVFALAISGCVTTQGGGASAPAAKSDSGSKSGNMLTKEDYERMGIKEMGAK
jgi:hypothetical protein